MLYVYHKIVTRVLSDTTLVLFYKFGKDFINIGLFYLIGFLSFCCSILRRISQENTFILVNICFILMLIIVCPKIFHIPLLNSRSLRLRSIGKIFIEGISFLYIIIFHFDFSLIFFAAFHHQGNFLKENKLLLLLTSICFILLHLRWLVEGVFSWQHGIFVLYN